MGKIHYSSPVSEDFVVSVYCKKTEKVCTAALVGSTGRNGNRKVGKTKLTVSLCGMDLWF